MKKMAWIVLFTSLCVLTACDRGSNKSAAKSNEVVATEKVKSAVDAASKKAKHAADAISKQAKHTAAVVAEKTQQAANVVSDQAQQAGRTMKDLVAKPQEPAIDDVETLKELE